MKDNLVLLAMLMAGTLAPHATPATAAENMQFRGTLIEAPGCVIEQGRVLDIDFGESLGVSRIDGTNYRQAIDYRLECQADPKERTVVLSVHGTATGFDSAAIQTDMPDLGIRLLRDGEPFELDAPLPIDPLHPPVLEAVPVQRPGTHLEEGSFDATATLQADYQ